MTKSEETASRWMRQIVALIEMHQGVVTPALYDVLLDFLAAMIEEELAEGCKKVVL